MFKVAGDSVPCRASIQRILNGVAILGARPKSTIVGDSNSLSPVSLVVPVNNTDILSGCFAEAVLILDFTFFAHIVAHTITVFSVGLTSRAVVGPVASAVICVLDLALVTALGTHALTSLSAVFLVSSAVEVPLALA